MPMLKPFEQRLGLLCARPHFLPAKTPQMQDLAESDIDWQSLIAWGQKQRLLPLFYSHLLDYADVVPAAVLDELKQHYVANAVRNAMLGEKLLEIMEALDSKGITALPIKGPILAVQAYGNTDMRIFDDLDILVDKDDVLPAFKLLQEMRFVPTLELSEPERNAHIAAGWGCTAASPDNAFFVEFDSGIAADFFSVPLSLEVLNRAATDIEVGRGTLRTACVPDTMVMLCVHGVKHRWKHLSWLSDIAALAARTDPLFLNAIVVRAGKYGVRRLVLASFELSRRMLGTELPHELSGMIAKDKKAVLLANAMEPLALSDDVDADVSHLRALMIQLRGRERMSDRLEMLWKQAVTPSYGDWQFVKLPAWAFGLYYAVRPIRICSQLLKRLFRRRSTES